YRMVSSVGWRPVALGVLITLVISFLFVNVALHGERAFDGIANALASAGVVVNLFPGIVVAFLWPRRWLTISAEAMLPSTRRQFIRQVGAAMLLDQLTLWLASLLTAVLPLVVLS